MPEVETIRRQLDEFIPRKVIEIYQSPFLISILKEKIFSPVNLHILKIERYGKYLNFIFENNFNILSHLGMSGSFRVAQQKITVKHTHLQFKCEGGVFLAYVDPRRFGKMYWVNKNYVKKIYDRLGVDVFSLEFTERYIKKILEKHPNKVIKGLLLQQEYFAGIGNYMVSEICHAANILPHRKACSISLQEIMKIKRGCNKIIAKSLKHQGLSFHGGYQDIMGHKGKALKYLMVFNQKECGNCGQKIIKYTLAGRGTYYCPKCQK